MAPHCEPGEPGETTLAVSPEERRRRRRAAVPPQASRPWPLPCAASPVLAALEAELLNADPGDRGGILDRFEARVMAAGTPLVEAGSAPDRRIVSFLRRGPALRGVYLEANRISDATDPGDTLMRPVAGTDLVALSLEMPASWIGTYRFIVPQEPPPAASPHEGVRLEEYRVFAACAQEDPYCRERAVGGRGPVAHGVVALEGAPGVPRGAATPWRRREARVLGPVSGQELALTVLTHPEAGAGCPLVVCLDGEVWERDPLLVRALAAAVDEGRVRAPRLALLHAAGSEQRQLDWACEPGESRALLEAVLAEVGPGVAGEPGMPATGGGTEGAPGRAGDHGVLRGPVVVAGQSLGGLFAMLCAVRHGDLVDAAVAQSASLWWPRREAMSPGPGRWFEEVARRGACAPVVLQAGRLEWNLVGAVLHARSLLEALGALVPTEHDLVTGGHDLAWWRRALPGAIEQALAAAGGREIRQCSE